MDTAVTIQVPRAGADRVEAAFSWFHHVEACCSRFDPRSELRRVTAHVGVPVAASTLLFHAVHFALTVARESHGVFDPTIGSKLEALGFNRNYRTGERVEATITTEEPVSYLDVELDPERQTILLRRPLILDLGAVAKGLAIDLAAKELEPLQNFAIDAGGDLYLGGRRPDGAAWSVGIRNPRPTCHPTGERGDELIEVLHVSDTAVCTSGDYERRAPDASQIHHIVDPRTGASAKALASVTVVAPTAMLADAVATTAFVLGPRDGLRLCELLGVDALMLSSSCERYATRGMRSDQYRSNASISANPERAADDRAGHPDRPFRTGRRP
jgi:thiamine biosynthesis lipoprotein